MKQGHFGLSQKVVPPQKKRVNMKITILEGPFKGREFDFTSPSVTIGRDGGNQLILDTDGVSRCHAEIKQLADGSWIISDLNSTNGVKIGGVRIDGSAPMTDG